MYTEYWGLKEKPFENTPDPRFFYPSSQHEEGLSRLLYVVQEKKGAGILTGIFGCGKTLLARALIQQLHKNIYQIAYIDNPYLKAVELLRSIARMLGAEGLPEKLSEMSRDFFLQTIGEILSNNLKDGKETIIVIDEAHTIDEAEVLEELRLLLNFQSEVKFLLTLILMGQPELLERIHKNKQLEQRIAMAYNLSPLSDKETLNYINYRLGVAGAQKKIIADNALTCIYQNSGGIPRRINQICDMALLVGFSKKLDKIEEIDIRESIESLGF